ncbi:MAG TPA: HAMP domain-containing sensor histidine kinase [Moheibacter sp.]|nr:HAMP domain-containing sensor histidine kinase [Moheibacter sp.]
MNRFTLLKNRNLSKWMGFLFAFLIFGTTVWFSNQFVNQLKAEEKLKVENFAHAVQLLGSDEILSSNVQEYLVSITTANESMPVILVDDLDEIVLVRNLSADIENNPEKLQRILAKMKQLHEPIVVDLGEFGQQYVFYENSKLLKRLQYFPMILILTIILFVYFSYWYFTTLKNTEQSFLWAGMAKETAHQIGTPLSSLMGWIEILKMEDTAQQAVYEMENDIQRLEQITERFSKIGSLPELKMNNIVEITETTVTYLKSRVSKKVDVQFNSDKQEIRIPLNVALYSWVIENLIKNAVDAMQNVGALHVHISEELDEVQISIIDSGPGIAKKFQKRIFEPGFTTKKRGWGLGLSLAKRIIENYHKGKIFVAKSDKAIGTEIRIVLKK